MRKPLGKMGEAFIRPFPHAATFLLLLSAAFFLALPETITAQVWVSSGFTVTPGSQTVTATCSTTGVVPGDYLLFLAACVVTPSNGTQAITNTQCDIQKLPYPLVTEIEFNSPAAGNPTGVCSIVFQPQPGVTYTINSVHGLYLTTPDNYGPPDCYVNGLGEEMPCYIDPEGFYAFAVANNGPTVKTQSTSITQEVTSTYPAQEYPMPHIDVFAIANSSAVYTAPCSTPKPASTNALLPKTWFAGESYNITITGTGFTTPANATAACPVTPVVAKTSTGSVGLSGVTVVSPTQITATVMPDASDPTELAEITVGNSSNGGAFSVRTQILGNQIQCGPSLNCTPTVITTTDGSTPPAQTAVVGQQIVLNTTTPVTTAYDGPTLTPTWTVGGTNIGGWTPSNTSGPPPNPTTLNNTPNLTTYWIYPGNAIPVTYQYCVNIQGANPVLQCSLPANAAFNVTGPSVSSMSTPTGYVGIFAGPLLGYGPTGIQFNPTLSNTTGDSGQFDWVQLITNDTLTLTSTTGTIQTCINVTVPPTSSGTGLDTLYPYATGTSTHDNPSGQLNSTTYTREARSFSAQMYLLWDPLLPSSIPVPLGSVTWGWSGTAAYSSGSWSLISSSTTTPSWGTSSSYPTWSDLMPYSGQVLCQ